MWLHLTIHRAPRGRLPNEYKVPVGERIEDFNPIINTMALVATLIATVTFAAAFTMPGGHDTSPGNLGVANLTKKAALRAFILSDTVAMSFSIVAVLALALAVYFEQEMQRRICLISWALINLAMRGSLVAFMSGLFVVIAPKALWEAISVCIIVGTWASQGMLIGGGIILSLITELEVG
ncbi:ankyrin repeat-containing protein NPR4-like [Rhododendron vialii]|uniref:ankyrin repeat-containing protein NPR4-like n=1 Tax=Rhododendron vialii TaxID=182163 RepID=UPI00265D65FA|nr:ankyrin repeat-containing protein NPR4-like [Rhododendron vialii]